MNPYPAENGITLLAATVSPSGSASACPRSSVSHPKLHSSIFPLRTWPSRCWRAGEVDDAVATEPAVPQDQTKVVELGGVGARTCPRQRFGIPTEHFLIGEPLPGVVVGFAHSRSPRRMRRCASRARWSAIDDPYRSSMASELQPMIRMRSRSCPPASSQSCAVV